VSRRKGRLATAAGATAAIAYSNSYRFVPLGTARGSIPIRLTTRFFQKPGNQKPTAIVSLIDRSSRWPRRLARIIFACLANSQMICRQVPHGGVSVFGVGYDYQIGKIFFAFGQSFPNGYAFSANSQTITGAFHVTAVIPCRLSFAALRPP